MRTEGALVSSKESKTMQQVAPGVACLPIVFVNALMVGEPGGPWALVDSGLPKYAARIRRAAEERYGAGAKPEAIILTHGHFDHAGSALELSEYWNVPVYAHPLELPYLTGKSPYPPQDPTVGGALALMSRFFPHRGINLGERVRPLPADGRLPGMPGWAAYHTPGHTAGHTSFFREGDRTLIAGDALATVNQDSALAMLTKKQEFYRPPSPFTTDWQAAHQSVEKLAALRPVAVAAGHGVPMNGPGVAEELAQFAENFTPPPKGRYVREPALADENGITRLPPPVPDPLPAIVAGVGLAALAGAAVTIAARRSKDRT